VATVRTGELATFAMSALPSALIANASYGPDQIKVLTQAFDEAWGQIVPNVGDRPEAREAGRYRLATLILRLAHNGGQLDVDKLRDTAVDLMRANVTKLGPKR
jgi:hypothetical protein